MDNAGPAFGRVSLAGVIHQDAANGPGGNGKEMRPVSPHHPTLVDETEIGFVDQGGGLEGVVGPLVPQLPSRDTPEIPVDRGIEPVRGTGIPATHFGQEFGDVLGFGHGDRG